MPPEESPSRIPPPKRSPGFVARGVPAYATASYRTRHSQTTGSRRSSGQRRQRTIVQVKREWVVILLMVLLPLAAAGGLWLLGRIQSARSDDQPVSVFRPAAVPLEKWRGPVPSVVAERFMDAKTHEDRLEWVRNPAEVDAAMKEFFQRGPGATEQVTGFQPMASGSSGDLLFESFNVQISGAPGRLLSVSVDPQGAKVDFECYARSGSVSWDHLLSGKVSEAAEVRVVLQQGAFYLRRFADEARWMHFKATSPDLPETLDFYLDRQHPSARELSEKKASMFRATLSIRAVDGSEKHRQFQISGVKALDWVEPG
jgi:hypothetical protein